MASKFDEKCEAETAASGTIVEAYRQSLDSDDDDDSGISLAVVHYRGGQTEFDLGCYYAASQDALDRVTGPMFCHNWAGVIIASTTSPWRCCCRWWKIRMNG